MLQGGCRASTLGIMAHRGKPNSPTTEENHVLTHCYETKQEEALVLQSKRSLLLYRQSGHYC